MSDRPPYDIQPSGPNIIIRILWFVLIGWWLGAIVSAIAWFLNITIIGLPPGLYLINRLPTIITLRPQGQNIRMEHGVVTHGQDQQPFMLRALYFALVGWWLSGLWLVAAYAALMTVILIPASFWMYNRIGAVTTLYRS